MSGALLLPIYILLFLALIWFLMIRPQQRRRRDLQNLIDRLAPGDDVVTVSGLYGTVTEIEDGDTILLEVAEDVDIRVAKGSIARVIDESALASAESPSSASSS